MICWPTLALDGSISQKKKKNGITENEDQNNEVCYTITFVRSDSAEKSNYVSQVIYWSRDCFLKLNGRKLPQTIHTTCSHFTHKPKANCISTSMKWKWRHYWLKFIFETQFVNELCRCVAPIIVSDRTSIWFFKTKKKSPILFESESTIVFPSKFCYICLMNKHMLYFEWPMQIKRP